VQGPLWLNACQSISTESKTHWNHWTSTESLELIGTHWNSLELIGTHWNSLELTVTHWNSLELTGTHWNLLEPTGTYWNLLDTMDTSEQMADNNTTPPTMEQTFHAFMQQMVQSNAISQQTLQGLQRVLEQGTNPPQTKKRKEKLPQLSEFDGTRSKWDGWEIEARNKIKTDGRVIGTDMDQLRYIFARLRSNARNMCLAFVRTKEEDENGSGSQLLDYLASTYSDPNQQKKALSNVYSIRQKTHESFARFLPRFETELANAGALSFNDTIKISLLENAISHSMQERLVSVFPVPTEYGAFTSLLQTIGSRLDAIKTPGKGQIPWKGQTQQRYMQQDDTKMDWEPTHTFAAQSPAKQRAKWVGIDEIQRRRSSHLCIRCGASGHMISSCHYAPAQPPTTIATTKVVEFPQLEEEAAESEKE
jgi:hypothetical protein